jgi:hypothetical protein
MPLRLQGTRLKMERQTLAQPGLQACPTSMCMCMGMAPQASKNSGDDLQVCTGPLGGACRSVQWQQRQPA